jgi:hypothetical protein
VQLAVKWALLKHTSHEIKLAQDHLWNPLESHNSQYYRQTTTLQNWGWGPARWWDIRYFDGPVYDRSNKFLLEDNLWWNDLIPYTSHNISTSPTDTTTLHQHLSGKREKRGRGRGTRARHS